MKELLKRMVSIGMSEDHAKRLIKYAKGKKDLAYKIDDWLQLVNVPLHERRKKIKKVFYEDF